MMLVLKLATMVAFPPVPFSQICNDARLQVKILKAYSHCASYVSYFVQPKHVLKQTKYLHIKVIYTDAMDGYGDAMNWKMLNRALPYDAWFWHQR